MTGDAATELLREEIAQELRTELEYRLRTVASYYRTRGRRQEEPDPEFLVGELDVGTARFLELPSVRRLLADRQTLVRRAETAEAALAIARRGWDSDRPAVQRVADAIEQEWRGQFRAEADDVLDVVDRIRRAIGGES